MKLEELLIRFGRIRCAPTAYGPAPHKPVFLITLLDLMDVFGVDKNRFEITPQWVALFKENWNLLVVTLNQNEFGLPFFHLQTDGIWKVFRWDGSQLKSAIKNMFVLAEEVNHCELSPEVFSLCIDPGNRQRIKQYLLEQFFPQTKARYLSTKGNQIALFDEVEMNVLNEPTVIYNTPDDEDMGFVRSGAFQKVVLRVYNNTCSISGLRVIATSGISMVDACHITPFHQSGDNSISNGFALCPNLHRAFDRGLIAIGPDYRVLVSNAFQEDASTYGIRIFEGKQIHLPHKKAYFPLKENFEWHRERVFKR